MKLYTCKIKNKSLISSRIAPKYDLFHKIKDKRGGIICNFNKSTLAGLLYYHFPGNRLTICCNLVEIYACIPSRAIYSYEVGS